MAREEGEGAQQDAHFGSHLHGPCDGGKGAGGNEVVVAHDEQVTPAGAGHEFTKVAVVAEVLRVLDVHEALGVRGGESFGEVTDLLALGRVVFDDDAVPVVEILGEGAVEQVREPEGPVVRRDGERDERTAHRSTGESVRCNCGTRTSTVRYEGMNSLFWNR